MNEKKWRKRLCETFRDVAKSYRVTIAATHGIYTGQVLHADSVCVVLIDAMATVTIRLDTIDCIVTHERQASIGEVVFPPQELPS